MLHVRKVIQKISEKESKEFIFWLKQNDAGKLVRLFLLLNENKLEESSIARELETTPSGFYTLKSRLNAKIQEFFAHNVPESNIDLLRNVANIPNLLFNSPREIAITHLLKMEKDLIEYDMPFALTTVYSALKKLTRYSQKYFDYAQLYNKHMAYTMTIDKVKELLADFNKTLGEYLMSRDEKELEVLELIQQQMHNYAQLYPSHHLIVYQNILDIEFALFVIGSKHPSPPAAIEEMLLKTGKILRSYKGDTSYSYMSTLFNFLWFHYYEKQKQPTKATEYFDPVNTKLPVFLLSNFCCFPTQFLLSKISWYLNMGKEKRLYEESKWLASTYSPDIDDTPNYINYIKYQAIGSYYAGRYSESVTQLNELLNMISFRNFTYAEIEIKLFLATCYLLTGKSELASGLIKNIQRKIRDLSSESFENAKVYAKMLSLCVSHPAKERSKKLLQLRSKFQAINQQPVKMLEFIRLDNTFLKAISLTDI